MSITIEDEIHMHLSEGHPASFIAEWLYEKMIAKDFEWTQTNLNTFYYFLFRAGRNDLVLYFFQKNVSNEGFHWHRGYLLLALTKSFKGLPDALKPLFLKSLAEDDSESHWLEASQTKIADQWLPEIKNWRKKLVTRSEKRFTKMKSDLLQKFHLFHSQQLIDPAKKLIRRLERVFPNDPEIKSLADRFKESDAQEVFDKYKFRARRDNYKPKTDPDVASVQSHLERNILLDKDKYIDSIEDLVILCIFIECDKTALALLDVTKLNLNTLWLYLELLIKNNRNLELLNLLHGIEKQWSNVPDTFLTTTYYRAIAYWNLGEKNSALEVMEALVDTHPGYRSSQLLLEEWKKL